MHIEAAVSNRPFVSAHAHVRGQQRGIRRSERDFVFMYGDREVPAGSGLYWLSISEKMMGSLLRDGLVSPRIAERCKRLRLITDGCTVVTNYRTARRH